MKVNITSNGTIHGPSDISVEGVVHGLRREPVEFLTNLHKSYGDIVRLPFGAQDLYLLGHPDFIREIFIDGSVSFAKRKDSESEQQYLGFISNFVPLFETDRIGGYAASITDAAARAHRRWQEKFAAEGSLKVDIYREIGRITLEVVAKTLFAVDAQDDAAALWDAILTMDHGYGFDPIESTLGGLMPEANRTITVESKDARAFIESYIECLARNEQQRNSGSFLGALVRSASVEQAVSKAMTVMLGMHEVTATTVPWTWYNLAKSPEIDVAVGNELTHVLRGRVPRYEDVPALSFTSMCLAETRRLYPSVWIVGRFVRPDVSFGPYSVRAGSVVLASQHITHRDPRFYPNPDKFDSTRWTPEAVAARPRFSYFPFSAGPRACAGEAFVELQDLLVFATLAQHWQAKLAADQKPKAIPQKSSAPRPGIEMILTPRHAASVAFSSKQSDPNVADIGR